MCNIILFFIAFMTNVINFPIRTDEVRYPLGTAQPKKRTAIEMLNVFK